MRALGSVVAWAAVSADGLAVGRLAAQEAEEESKFTREFHALAAGHEDAVREATAELEKEYAAALRTLLDRAERAKDEAAAVKVRAALEALEAKAAKALDPAKVRTPRQLRDALAGTAWTMASTRGEASTSKFLIVFVSDSELRVGDEPLAEWRAVDARRVRTGEAVFVFDSQLRNYECENWYDTGPRFGVRRK
jgi:hypothetical protein